MIRTQTSLTNDQIQKNAPSAFAGQPYEKQSDRYAFVPTSVVIDGMRSRGFFPVEARQSSSRIDGKEFFTKHMIRFQSQADICQLGDSLIEMILINSHDGTSRYVLAMGVKRLVCLNGMMVSERLAESFKIRHTGNILDEVASGTEALMIQAPKVANAIKTWRQITLASEEQKALAVAAHSLRFDQGSSLAQTVEPERLLSTRRYDDNGDDLWSVFNRIQENVIRGMSRRLVYRRMVPATRGVKSINEDVRLNRAMWTSAEKMAELKS